VKEAPPSRGRAQAERDWQAMQQGALSTYLIGAADAPAPARRGRAVATLRGRAERKRALQGVAARAMFSPRARTPGADPPRR
jgi:hypothetical protein